MIQVRLWLDDVDRFGSFNKTDSEAGVVCLLSFITDNKMFFSPLFTLNTLKFKGQ